MSATTVDTLITRYTLEDRYSSKADRIAASTAKVGRGMAGAKPPVLNFKNLLSDTSDASGGLGDALSMLSGVAAGPLGLAFTFVGQAVMKVLDFLKKAAVAAIGLGVAFAGLSYWATTQYAKFQSIKLTFAGIADSMEKASQMMAAIKSYSFKSVFDEEPLAQAALQLTQLNLSAKEFLPVIEAIAMRSGEISPEKLLEVVSILRRLKGGQIADALGAEGLGRFGISKSDLTSLGAVFDASGDFKGNMQDALKVLKALANSPETERIRKMLEDSPETRISNALGQMQSAVREFGATMSKWVIPALETVGNVVGYLAQSGIIERVGKGFAKLFGDSNGQRALVHVLMYVASALEVMPVLLEGFGKAVQIVFGLVIKAMTAPIQMLLFAIDKLTGSHLQDAFNNLIKGALLNLTPLGQLLKSVMELHGVINVLTGQKMRGFDEWQQEQKDKGPTPFPDITKPDKDQPVLQAIKENTAQTARNTGDLQRFALGGGDLGKYGATPEEMGRYSSRGKRQREVKVTVIGDADGLIERALRQYTKQLKQAGLLK